ncbi:MAG: hypothetical protein KAY32_04670 [Candidatus Eisenbacteria sp.]|nr:hypothetical protein [Candidatus Eisenbacteria bacterium]
MGASGQVDRRAAPGRVGVGVFLAVLSVVVLVASCSDDSSQPPVLLLEPAAIHLAPGDSAGVFTVRNGGGGVLTWSLTNTAGWFDPEISSGETARETIVAFAIDHDSIWVGPPTAIVALASNGGDEQLAVHMWQALRATPDTLIFSDSLFARTIELCNDGDDPLPWSAELEGGWLDVDHRDGVLGEAPDTLRFSVSREGLAQGDYSGTVRIDAGGYGRDTIPVLMSVSLAGTVSGHVFHAETEIPVSGARVILLGFEDLTDEEGAFFFTGMPVGSRVLRATREGYGSVEEVVEIPESGLVHDLWLSTDTYAHRVSGRLINAEGVPIYRATGVLLNPDRSATALVDETDLVGYYQIERVPEGVREIRWTHGLYFEQITVFEVSGGDQEHDVQLTARPLPPPFLPDGPGVERFDCREIHVEWPIRLEETVGGYRVYRSPAGQDAYADVSGLIDRQQGTFIDRDLGEGQYLYRVVTENIDQLTGAASPPGEVAVEPWLILNDGDQGLLERWGQTMIYCSERNSLIVFAGTGCESGDCGHDYRDVWELALDDSQWQRIDIGGNIRKRFSHTAIYDVSRNRMIVYGGKEYFAPEEGYGDTWAFDLASQTWSKLDDGAEGPSSRWGHTAIWDSARDRMVIYGGTRMDSGGRLNDVWAFDLATDTWELVHTGEPGELPIQPDARANHAAVHVRDAQRDWMVVYGGDVDYFTFHQDTWALDLVTGSWIPLPAGPGFRAYCVAVYSPARGEVLIYGGRDEQIALADMHALVMDPVPHWELRGDGTEPGTPGPRYGLSAVFDPDLGMMVFGGNTMIAITHDAWAYCAAR